jgi:hypothetical protein
MQCVTKQRYNVNAPDISGIIGFFHKNYENENHFNGNIFYLPHLLLKHQMLKQMLLLIYGRSEERL